MIRTTLLALFLSGSTLRADDWPQFRGPSGSGKAPGAEAPVEWGTGKNIRWRVSLDGLGNSSPIVSGGRVFVTVATDKGKSRSLHCFDRKTGGLLWTATVNLQAIEPTREDNPSCGSTPCADGERVVVWHASAGLHCYDYEGKSLWSRDFGRIDHMWGYGSSPIFHGDLVLLNVGPGDRSFLVAVNRKSGDVVWKTEEPGGQSKGWIGSWCTPRIVTIDGKDEILVAWPNHVKAYEPATGREIWRCEGLGKLVYADVAVDAGIGVATGEDEGGDSIGFRLGGKGDVTASARLWSAPRPLEVGTGMIVDGHLWTADNGGVLRCTDVQTGHPSLEARLPGGAAWSSVVSSGGRLYITTRSGDTVVFRPDRKEWKPLAVNKLGEPTNSTPAISDGEIFLRTSKALYCIAAP
ncbi:MAG TPA: PQQ-binding-like beta-propeller repeat protein [Planctomycetota bacterium]|nr:PQQ-binding-like beta-propeller repeat protein [Planctomycetota bacterium]